MTDYIFTTQKIQEAFPNWTKFDCVYMGICLNLAYKAGLISPPQDEEQPLSDERETVSKIVPNCIGRLDDLVKAIRNEEYFTSAVLLNKEVERLEQKSRASYQVYLKDELRRKDVEWFREQFRDHDFRQSCTREVEG
jgi:hypothetical protein